ncbi:hypothetical protein QUC31_015659 [Theobroma cacao]
MITTKKLIRVAIKWQKIAAIGRNRITSARTNKKMDSASHSNKSSAVDKSDFVIYTMDEKRFVIPLAFLSNIVFHELLKMSEEEFGLPRDGPIKLLSDSVIINYIVSLVKQGLAEDLEREVLNSITTYRCSSDTYFHQGHGDRQLLVCGF